MSAISQSKHNDLTLMHVVGQLTVADSINNLSIFYENNPTLKLAIDMRLASIQNIDPSAVSLIINIVNNYKNKRKGGKTAIIAPDDLIFGFGRMFDATAEIKNADITVMTFRTIEEAESWLEVKIPDVVAS